MIETIIPTPTDGEYPSEYAERLGLYYASLVSDEHKKDLGQFFTPLSIANFMAGFGQDFKSRKKVKILDPGCGIGILSASLIEHLLKQPNSLDTIELVVFETDINIIILTEKCFDYLRIWVKNLGVEFKFFLCKNDFILHNSNVLNNQNSDEFYDLIVSNPPYFKLPKEDERVKAAKQVIHGQTNIYSIFLVIAAKLLDTHGKLIFITPRSFCSGSYFRLFREIFFSIANINLIHLFNSRNSAFKKDKVLQENIIIVASKKSSIKANQLKLSFRNTGQIKISVSHDSVDLQERKEKIFHWADLVNMASYQKILHLPTSRTDEDVIKIFKTWTGSLVNYGLKISTGPIVDFRSIENILNKKTRNVVPLIWLHNIEPMKISWPKNNYKKGKEKGQYIYTNKNLRLVNNKNYVFLRRFSTKEANRRLIAAPYLRNFPNYSKLGIENHLNYIYGVNSELTEVEAVGLASLLNSKIFDIYFRTFNGNINVSATELKDFPLPSYNLIRELGEEVVNMEIKDVEIIDVLVSKIFDLKIDLSNYG